MHRTERHHIGRSDARVRALMFGEVDQRDRLFDPAEGCVGHRRRRSDERQNAAIVIRVGFAVKQHDIGHREDRLHDRIHFGGIAPFGKIRNTLYKLSRHETTLCHTALLGGCVILAAKECSGCPVFTPSSIPNRSTAAASLWQLPPRHIWKAAPASWKSAITD